jgi:hypothetical protein
MADAVTTRLILETPYQYIVHLTNISDGTGETAVIKVDKSAIAVATDGAEPNSLDIEQVRWSIQGFTSVRLLWDHTTDDLAMVLCNNGYEDFTGKYGVIVEKTSTSGLLDPRSSGGAGDILLTTNGGVSGSSYDITLWLKKSAV